MLDSPIALVGLLIVAVLMVGGGLYTCASCETIPPGHVGVSVKKCGGGGVDGEPISTGYYWKSPFCEDVIECPTNLQTLLLDKATATSPDDESITVTSSEGLPIGVDVSLSFTLDPAKVPEMYTKYRQDIAKIAHVFMRQTVREGLQAVFAKYSAEQLYADKKEAARAEVQAFVTHALADDGFVVNQLTVNELRVPKQVTDAINAKVAMIQEAQKAEQEVRKTRALAEQRKAEAEGNAAATRLKADAEAYYNTTVAKSITKEFVQFESMKRWNGALPQFAGSGAVPFVQLDGAKP